MNDDLWNSIFGDFGDIERRFERMFSELSKGNGKTYGYTMYQGPDGIPHVREYGNSVGTCSPMISASEREPFTDVTRNGDKVSVVVELPGVKKEDIVLEGNRSSLQVSVDTENKKFRKSIALPCEVDENSATAEYNNGILEVNLTAKNSLESGRRIAIA